MVTDSLVCRNHGIELEWTLVQVFADDLLQRYPATVVFFCDVSKLPACGVFSPTSDSMVTATATFLQSCDDLACDFPPFALFREVLF